MQLDFFPEEIKVLESDSIDISTIEFDPKLAAGKQIVRDWLYSEIVVGKYFLYKTGGINRWHQDQGQTFPYLQNKHTGNIIKIEGGSNIFNISGDHINKHHYIITHKIYRIYVRLMFPLESGSISETIDSNYYLEGNSFIEFGKTYKNYRIWKLQGF